MNVSYEWSGFPAESPYSKRYDAGFPMLSRSVSVIAAFYLAHKS